MVKIRTRNGIELVTRVTPRIQRVMQLIGDFMERVGADDHSIRWMWDAIEVEAPETIRINKLRNDGRCMLAAEVAIDWQRMRMLIVADDGKGVEVPIKGSTMAFVESTLQNLVRRTNEQARKQNATCTRVSFDYTQEIQADPEKRRCMDEHLRVTYADRPKPPSGYTLKKTLQVRPGKEPGVAFSLWESVPKKK